MPYVLPTPEPRQQWYNDYGEMQGLGTRLLLAMLSGGVSGLPTLGKQPTTPTAGNSGQIQFPSGARTNTSPLEQAMIQQLGGAPNRQGGTVPLTYQPPTKWGFVPNIDQQIKQANLQQTQALAPYYQAVTRQLTAPQQPSSVYQVGDILERGGKRYKIVGMDTDWMPLVEPD